MTDIPVPVEDIPPVIEYLDRLNKFILRAAIKHTVLHELRVHTRHTNRGPMPAVFVPGGPYLYPETLPMRFFLFEELAATGDVSHGWINNTGGWALACGFDATAVGGASSSIDVEFILGACVFYHDSQSIGEGGGITFSWRGMHIVKPEESIGVAFNLGGNSANVYCTGWGLLLAKPADFIP